MGPALGKGGGLSHQLAKHARRLRNGGKPKRKGERNQLPASADYMTDEPGLQADEPEVTRAKIRELQLELKRLETPPGTPVSPGSLSHRKWMEQNVAHCARNSNYYSVC